MANEAYITKHYKGEASNKGDTQTLSIVLGPDSFCYTIFNKHFKEVVELVDVRLVDQTTFHQDYVDRIAFLIHNFQLSGQKFSKINIGLLNKEFTLIPSAYAANDLKKLVQFSTGNVVAKEVRLAKLGNISLGYLADSDLFTLLEKTFSNATIRHLAAVNINLLFEQHSLKENNLLLLIGKSVIEIAARNETELLFYNVFSYETNEDILYYLLFAMEQFDLNPLYVKLAVASERETDDELFKTFKKYIKQVRYCVNDPSIVLKGEVAQLPSHYYFTVLNQHLCEL